MRKINAVITIFLPLLFLCVISTIASPKGVWAQEPYVGELFFPIKNIGKEWIEGSSYIYYFLVDLSIIKENTDHVLSELSISTSQGVVLFNSAQLKDPALKMVVGSLATQNIEKFQVTKVVGTIDGKVYDLTQNSYDDYQIPWHIAFPIKEQAKTCSGNTLDLLTIEGKFIREECVDDCYATISVNGKDDLYVLYTENLSYFFNNEANVNKKIKANARKFKYPIFDEDGEIYRCNNETIITELLVLE